MIRSLPKRCGLFSQLFGLLRQLSGLLSQFCGLFCQLKGLLAQSITCAGANCGVVIKAESKTAIRITCLMTFPADWARKEPPRGGSGLPSAARDGSWICWPFDGPS